jgi:uncharacterized protein with PIN domain
MASNATWGNDYKYIVDTSLPGIARHLRILGMDTLYDSSFNRNYLMFLARRDNRVIVTQSVKLKSMVDLMCANRQRKKNKICEYEILLEDALTRENEAAPRLFSHEKSRLKHLTADQLRERIEIMKEEVEDDDQTWYEYKICFLKETGRYEQLRELVSKMKIVFILERVFDYCTKCNSKLIRIADKNEIRDRVAQSTFELNSKRYFNCTDLIDNFSCCSGCSMITWGTRSNQPRDSFVRAIKFCKDFSYHPVEHKAE